MGDGLLLGTDVIQVNQVMLNILRLWRNITSSHLNPYPVDERAKPMKLTHKKTMAVCGTSATRSEEHTSELQSLMRTSYAVFCLKKKTQKIIKRTIYQNRKQPKIRIN